MISPSGPMPKGGGKSIILPLRSNVSSGMKTVGTIIRTQSPASSI